MFGGICRIVIPPYEVSAESVARMRAEFDHGQKMTLLRCMVMHQEKGVRIVRVVYVCGCWCCMLAQQEIRVGKA